MLANQLNFLIILLTVNDITLWLSRDKTIKQFAYTICSIHLCSYNYYILTIIIFFTCVTMLYM